MLLKDLIFYVVYCDDSRLAFIKKQFADLGINVTVSFFKGYTPEDSQDWIVKGDTYSPEKLQCCFRSHVAAITHFVQSQPDKKFVCVLEDDVCFLKEGFAEALTSAINRFSNNPEIDYLSIGYLPTTMPNPEFKSCFIDEEKLSKLKTYGDSIYFDIAGKGFTVWGAQAQVFPMATAQQISDKLYKQKGSEVYQSVLNHIEQFGRKQSKMTYLTPDAIFPIMFSQAIVSPQLAIEGQVSSTIHDPEDSIDRMTNWKKYEEIGQIKLSNYYNN
jgi:GR25 family glycosyltransferase involved in LPS biosynthesis